VSNLPTGTELVRQGSPGTEMFLLLDGILAVEVDGTRIAEVGPGAVLGERALLEGGNRTASLIAVTPIRVARAAADAVDQAALAELALGHRREAATA
jgi:CRP-like cAMP-binding protein